MSASISLLRSRRRLKENSEDESGEDSDCSIKDLERKETIEQDARTIAAINMLTVSMVNQLLEGRGLDPFGKPMGSPSFEGGTAWASPAKSGLTRPTSIVRSVKENKKKSRKSVRFTPDPSKTEYSPEPNRPAENLDLVHTVSTPLSSLKMEPKFTPIRRSKVLKASFHRSIENEQDMTTENLNCSDSFERPSSAKDLVERSNALSEAVDVTVRTPLQTVTSSNQTSGSNTKEHLIVTPTPKKEINLSCSVTQALPSGAPTSTDETPNSPPPPVDQTEENENCESTFQTPVRTKWCHYFDPTSPEHMTPFLKALFDEREEKNKGKELSKSFSMLETTEDQPKLSVLKGVVAFVEVRRADEDRSSGFRWKLKVLGAQVEENFTKKVTHVVFQEGLLSTYRKAKESSVHLVSACWVMACDECLRRVPEDKYPIEEEDKYSMLAPLKKYIRRSKLMSPDLGNGNDEKRLARRLQAIKRRSMKVEATPSTEKTDDDCVVPPTAKTSNTKARTSPQSTRSSADKKSSGSSSLMSSWLSGKGKSGTGDELAKVQRSPQQSETWTSPRRNRTKSSPPKNKKSPESVEITELSKLSSEVHHDNVDEDHQSFPEGPVDFSMKTTAFVNRGKISEAPLTPSKTQPSTPRKDRPNSSVALNKSRSSTPRKSQLKSTVTDISSLSSKSQPKSIMTESSSLPSRKPSTPRRNQPKAIVTETSSSLLSRNLPSTLRKSQLQSSSVKCISSPSKSKSSTPRKSPSKSVVTKPSSFPNRYQPSTPKKYESQSSSVKTAFLPSKTEQSPPKNSRSQCSLAKDLPQSSLALTASLLSTSGKERKTSSKSASLQVPIKQCGKGSLANWLNSVSTAKRKADVAFGSPNSVKKLKADVAMSSSKRKIVDSNSDSGPVSAKKRNETSSSKEQRNCTVPTKKPRLDDSPYMKPDMFANQPKASSTTLIRKKLNFGPVQSKKITLGSGSKPQEISARSKKKDSFQNSRTSSALGAQSSGKSQTVITSHFRAVDNENKIGNLGVCGLKEDKAGDSSVISLTAIKTDDSILNSPPEQTEEPSAVIATENKTLDLGVTSVSDKTDEPIAPGTSEDKGGDSVGTRLCEDDEVSNMVCTSEGNSSATNRLPNQAGNVNEPSPPQETFGHSNESSLTEVTTGDSTTPRTSDESKITSDPSPSGITYIYFSEPSTASDGVSTEASGSDPPQDEARGYSDCTLFEVTTGYCHMSDPASEGVNDSGDRNPSQNVTSEPCLTEVKTGDTSTPTPAREGEANEVAEVRAGDSSVPDPTENRKRASSGTTRLVKKTVHFDVSSPSENKVDDSTQTEHKVDDSSVSDLTENQEGDSNGTTSLVKETVNFNVSSPSENKVDDSTQTEHKVDDSSVSDPTENQEGDSNGTTSLVKETVNSNVSNPSENTVDDSNQTENQVVDSSVPDPTENQEGDSNGTTSLVKERVNSNVSSPSENTAENISVSNLQENETADSSETTPAGTKMEECNASRPTEDIVNSEETYVCANKIEGFGEANPPEANPPEDKVKEASDWSSSCAGSDSQNSTASYHQEANDDIPTKRKRAKTKFRAPHVAEGEDSCDSLLSNEKKRPNSAVHTVDQDVSEEIKSVEKPIQYHTRRSMRIAKMRSLY